MSNKKTKLLINKQNELVGYKITNGNGETFIVPVVSGERAEQMLKNSNRGSKYLKPSFSQNGLSYQVSKKNL